MKHKIPAVKNKKEEIKGRKSILLKFPVALKKKAAPRPVIHKERIRTGR